ncbi:MULTISPECIES: hypothetical protein [Rhodococcus]|uniref:Uncharacterized protein n=1 Tax=Rhodococcus koreensis TaxID=99653 RepID=A0A1H4SUQ4_9NOCA|nr:MULTISPECIES: hypothetical protein [Rhodococcus]QSE82399.1 hypothetical protein JWS14_26175 [Rhodococcus koreensis]SEC47779.1 hypothetical protein SAMN04490239_4240 [Rhodococcus koreensis]
MPASSAFHASATSTTRGGATMSTEEIKARIEAMFADEAADTSPALVE